MSRSGRPRQSALLMGVAPLIWLNAIDPAVQSALAPSRNLPARWWAGEHHLRYGANDSASRRLHPHPAGNRARHFWHDCDGARPVDGRAMQPKNAGSAGAGGLAGGLWSATLSFRRSIRGLGFWNMVQVDSFSVFFHFLVAAITAVVILTSFEYMASAADPGRRILRADAVWRASA